MSPSRVALAVITSWGIRRYDHGFSPSVRACLVACLHHSIAARAFASTVSFVISFARLGSHSSFSVFVSTAKSGSYRRPWCSALRRGQGRGNPGASLQAYSRIAGYTGIDDTEVTKNTRPIIAGGAARRLGRSWQMGGYDASFLFVSLKANSSSSTLSRTTRSTHLSILASRCNLARNAARAASSPGSERAAASDRFTRTGASQADSSLARETTS
jgi:hypothetical protein